MKKTFDINFRLELEASVPVEASNEKEATDILKKKMRRIIEVNDRKIQEIDVETKIILVRHEEEYDL